MSRIQLRSGWLLLAAVAGLTSNACGLAEEYCDTKCECELCNDRKYDECVIEMDAEIDRADAYECTEDYDAYAECVISDASCEDENWGLEGDDCANEYEDLYDCIDDASDLGQTGPVTMCSCSCTCTGGPTVTACEGTGCCMSGCQAQCAAMALGTMVSPGEACSG
jgi:hypothetical protein